jgi:putative transposase
MRGFKSFASAARFCRRHDELRDLLRLRARRDQHVPAARRRLLHRRRANAAMVILGAA